MKSKIRKTVCKVLGHNADIKEVYAARVIFVNQNAPTPKYSIYEECICSRCNALLEKKALAEGLTRAELLQQEWFITK